MCLKSFLELKKLCTETIFSQVQEFGVCEVRDLKPNGANILVTEENKKEYVHLVCQMKMTGKNVMCLLFLLLPLDLIMLIIWLEQMINQSNVKSPSFKRTH